MDVKFNPWSFFYIFSYFLYFSLQAASGKLHKVSFYDYLGCYTPGNVGYSWGFLHFWSEKLLCSYKML